MSESKVMSTVLCCNFFFIMASSIFRSEIDNNLSAATESYQAHFYLELDTIFFSDNDHLSSDS